MEKFIKLFEGAKQNYKKTKNAEILYTAFERMAELYCDYFGIGDLFLGYAEELIDNGSYDAGVEIIRIVEKRFKVVANQTLLCIRLAEWEFENGNADRGKEYLERLMSKVDNYEESIEINELTDVWNKYKATLRLSNSVHFMKKEPRRPNECTLCIEDIMKLPQDDTLLSALFTHLNELCAYGLQINILSKPEKNVFYINEFIEDVNSGGISHYLYYRGDHFQELLASVTEANCSICLILLNMIEKKFPRNNIPSNVEKIQNHIEDMENRDVDFETEEVVYYEQVEHELVETLLSYVVNHKDDFR